MWCQNRHCKKHNSLLFGYYDVTMESDFQHLVWTGDFDRQRSGPHVFAEFDSLNQETLPWRMSQRYQLKIVKFMSAPPMFSHLWVCWVILFHSEHSVLNIKYSEWNNITQPEHSMLNMKCSEWNNITQHAQIIMYGTTSDQFI